MVNASLMPVGNALTGYELGSTFGSQFLAVNAIPGTAVVYDFKNFNTVTVQWRTTGSMAGSILISNDGVNTLLLQAQDMKGAQTRFVTLTSEGTLGSILPRWVQFVIGSASSATVTGSGFCDVFARAS